MCEYPLLVTEVFPAPAGINRLIVVSVQPAAGVPRASGDKPADSWFDVAVDPCSPRQRG
ncbi:hypothetical protein J5K46_005283 [Salmonella enterica subsp. enterica serovar Java]|nr:hypothetical protein [Salmonella enterica subsp. enterica serovar Java]